MGPHLYHNYNINPSPSSHPIQITSIILRGVDEDKVATDSTVPLSSNKKLVGGFDLHANAFMVSFYSQAKLIACIFNFGSGIFTEVRISILQNN